MTGLTLAGLIGSCLWTFLRITQLEPVQALVPESWKWKRLPLKAQLAVTWGLTGAATVATSFAAGVPPSEAIQAGITAVLAAAGLDATTKKGGSKLDQEAVAKDPDYRPGPAREALSVLLPIDRSKIPKP